MSRLDTIALVGAAGLCIFAVAWIRSPYRKVPPGPRGLPFLGNLVQLRGDMFSAFENWRKAFGNLFYINVAGQPMLIISSGKVAADLLDRRSANYSSRPRMIVGAEILSGGLFFVLNPDNAIWRRMRRAAHEAMKNPVVHRYHPMQTTEAVLLALSLLDSPTAWNAHLRRSAASLTMSMVYDHPPIVSETDPCIRDINNYAEKLSHAIRPGAHLVEFFPWMQYIPRPFAKWKREAEDWFAHYTGLFEGLLKDVAGRALTGSVRSCFTTALIDNAATSGLSERENAWAAGTIYATGAETTAGVMAWFLLAMVAYPDVQKHAQEELDAVVGRSRVPTFADLERLPYIQAVVRESLRWQPALPLGSPHFTTRDDWYEGMFIPKGTICITNLRTMNRDPEVFGPDATEFNPGRYIDEAGALKANSADDHCSYGFGRRICVGRHVANATLFIDIAILLWATRISRAKKDVGPLDVKGFMDDGMVVRPMPFGCDIEARFTEASHILTQERELLLQ